MNESIFWLCHSVAELRPLNHLAFEHALLANQQYLVGRVCVCKSIHFIEGNHKVIKIIYN
jgi:hypothetical protein